MAGSQIHISDPGSVDGSARVLKDSEADTGQAGLAVRVLSQNPGVGGTETVVGNVASGVADSGNPVKVGGLVTTGVPAGATSGQRKDLWVGAQGQQIIGFVANTLSDANSAQPLGVTDQAGGIRPLGTVQFLYNETGQDKQRGNTTASLIAAGTITTQTNKVITNYNGRFLDIVLNITAATSTPTATVAISGTTVSGYPFPILTGAAIVSTGTTVYRVGPGLTALTNLTANDLVPRNILVTVTVTGSVTYGVDYVLSV